MNETLRYMVIVFGVLAALLSISAGSLRLSMTA